MRWNKYKIVCVVFVVFIMLTGLSTAILGAKQIGYNMLIGYKENLEENATILDKVRAIITGCEDGMNTEYVLEDQCINLYGGFQKLLDKRVVNDVDPSNNVIKLNNGYLSFYTNESINVDEMIKNTQKFDTFLKKQGIDFLYVQVPYKISKYTDEVPEGIKNYNNDNADKYIKNISKLDIDNIDLRKLIKEEGINHSSIFFKTDHHWTPKAGLWAFGKIAKELNSNYGFNIDKKLWDESNYNIKTYKKCFLGSQGKRTGIYYGGLDDFDIITPKFKTDFEFKIESEKIYKKGEFKETLLDLSKFGTNDYFNTWQYDTYTGGDYGLINITNKMNNDGKKILLIKDSFSGVLIPFLAEGCSTLDVIDLRKYDGIGLEEYIENNKPDIVITMYNPNTISIRGEMFNFLSK